jgi:hypothetical protein
MKLSITFKSKVNANGLVITRFRIERAIANFKTYKSLSLASYWFHAGYDFSQYESKAGRKQFKLDFQTK